MKAISLHQPYASLIAHGLKHHETRSWPAPACIAHQRIAICATKITKDVIAALRQSPLSILVNGITVGQPWLLPSGAIVATAVVDYCCPTTAINLSALTAADLAAGDWSPGRFAWRLIDVRPVSTPFPIRGRQRVFNLPDDATTALVRLGAA